MDSSTHRPHSPSLPALPGAQEVLPSFLHDLNNYLGIILGNVELLLDRDTNDDKRGKRTQAIYAAALKTKDLILGLQEKLQ